MKIDAQTRVELEIFQTRDGSVSLFDRLDCTRTSGGRAALRRRFESPLSDRSRIVEVQAVVQWVTKHGDALDRLPKEKVLHEAQGYLSSPYETMRRSGAGSHWEAAWIRIKYRDLYKLAVRGVEITRGLVSAASDVSNAFVGAPGAGEDIIARFKAAFADPLLVQLLHCPAQMLGRNALMMDRAIRSREGQDALTRILDLMSEVDALGSMAKCTVDRGFCWPVAVDDGNLSIRGVYHPFLKEAVPNDLDPAGGTRIVFLTGPNMAGKTTYLKSCGTAVFLGQLGMGVPAASMTWAPFRSMISCLNTSDNLHRGVSFFQAEAQRIGEVAKIVQKAGPAFVLIDEMFKGTNVMDAIDGSQRVISAFSVSKASLFIISSHLLELVESVKSEDGAECHYFSAQSAAKDLHFDYVIRPGSSTQRLGMQVLEREGVLALLDQIIEESLTAKDS